MVVDGNVDDDRWSVDDVRRVEGKRKKVGISSLSKKAVIQAGATAKGR